MRCLIQTHTQWENDGASAVSHRPNCQNPFATPAILTASIENNEQLICTAKSGKLLLPYRHLNTTWHMEHITQKLPPCVPHVQKSERCGHPQFLPLWRRSTKSRARSRQCSEVDFCTPQCETSHWLEPNHHYHHYCWVWTNGRSAVNSSHSNISSSIKMIALYI